MKTKHLFLVALALLASTIAFSQVGIGTTDPHASAILELDADDKGFLPPRMTENERDNISTPPAGLMVWCNNCGSNGEMQIYNGTEWTNMMGGTASPYIPPQVGDFTEGGVVFYIFQNGDPGYVAGETHGLVCTIQDQSTSTWWNGSYTTTGATATGIGMGQTNTTAIISNQGTGTYAASICDNYSVTIGSTTYNDWFLPSEDELNLMYQRRGTINTTAGANGGSSFASTNTNAIYWSSTENASNIQTARRVDFWNGARVSTHKHVIFRVRAIRSF